MTYQEGTNGIPVPVEKALIKVKDWHDKYGDVEALSPEELEASTLTAADILTSIFLAVDTTWGWR